jgi:hypothetical protein
MWIFKASIIATIKKHPMTTVKAWASRGEVDHYFTLGRWAWIATPCPESVGLCPAGSPRVDGKSVHTDANCAAGGPLRSSGK